MTDSVSQNILIPLLPQIITFKPSQRLDFISHYNHIQKCQDMNLDYELSKLSQKKQGTNTSITIQTYSSNASKKQKTQVSSSIFHNFQKHLITFLKKSLVIVEKQECSQSQKGQEETGCYLWQAFKNAKLKSKKHLHFIVGMTKRSKLQAELIQLAKVSPHFQSIYNKCPIEQIICGLQFIGKEIVRQSKLIDKKYFKARTSVSKSQEFYQYYLNFIAELKQGQLKKRMSKKQKQKVIKNINRDSDNL